MADESITAHDKDIKFLKEQIDALSTATKEGLKEIRDDLRRLNESYIQRAEVEKELKRIEEMLKGKLDKEDFDPIRVTLNKLVWAVITPLIAGIVGAILYLIAHFAK